jgi:hypothetical protein
MHCWLRYWCALAIVKDLRPLRSKIYEQLIVLTQSNVEKAQQLINARGSCRCLTKLKLSVRNVSFFEGTVIM